MMKNNPSLVSIGMPVYNGENDLCQALDALLAQDYGNFELIISDNGSTDHTEEICQEYLKKDSRIRYYRNSTNLGASYNFTRVFQLAAGEFFMWASCHDVWTPDYISRLISVLQTDPDVALAYTETCWVDESLNDLKVSPYHLDTRGMRRSDRIKTVVKTLHALDLFYGLYRMAMLKKCRTKFDSMGGDIILMMELSFVGTIAEISGKGLLRRMSYPQYKNEAQWTAITLLRADPNYQNKKNVRAWWKMGWNLALGIWHAPAAWIEKVYLTFAVTRIFYFRFKTYLHHEIFHPLFPKDGKNIEIPDW